MFLAANRCFQRARSRTEVGISLSNYGTTISGPQSVLRKWEKKIANSLRDPAAMTELFETICQWLVEQGWIETPRSLSTRVWVDSLPQPTKYWTIEVIDCRVAVQWGSVTGSTMNFEGQRNLELVNETSAADWYASAVAAQRGSGCVEVLPRKTSWSRHRPKRVPSEHIVSDSCFSDDSPEAQWIEEFSRPAWVPIVEERDGGLAESKFSGIPWLAKGEAWPLCGSCRKPLALWLQLNLPSLPAGQGEEIGRGLLQFFRCHRSWPHPNRSEENTCKVGEEGSDPFGSENLIRIVSPSSVPPVQPPTGFPVYPPKVIVGWKEVKDYPHSEEYRSLPGYEDISESWDPYGEEPLDLNLQFKDIGGDKLGGWPAWCQGVRPVACPQCGEPMRPVFQIRHDDNLPVGLGDGGTGFISQCRKHRKVLAFSFDCG